MFNSTNEPRPAAASEAGFTLIELAVAIMILSGTFFGVIQAMPFSLTIVKRAESETQAAFLAQEKIEQQFSLGYANIATGTVETRQRLGPVGNPRYAFERETTVSCVTNALLPVATSDTGLKRIITTIYYIDAVSKNERSYSVAALLARR